MDDHRDDCHRNRKVEGDSMKIGPNQDAVPLNKADQGQAERTKEKPGETNSTASANGKSGADQVKPKTDSLHLSGHTLQGGELTGYDSHELRDQLAAARNLSKESQVDTKESGEIDSTKLDTIRQLVQSGFYDSKEVKLQIADKLADEIISDNPDKGDS